MMLLRLKIISFYYLCLIPLAFTGQIAYGAAAKELLSSDALIVNFSSLFPLIVSMLYLVQSMRTKSTNLFFLGSLALSIFIFNSAYFANNRVPAYAGFLAMNAAIFFLISFKYPTTTPIPAFFNRTGKILVCLAPPMIFLESASELFLAFGVAFSLLVVLGYLPVFFLYLFKKEAISKKDLLINFLSLYLHGFCFLLWQADMPFKSSFLLFSPPSIYSALLVLGAVDKIEVRENHETRYFKFSFLNRLFKKDDPSKDKEVTMVFINIMQLSNAWQNFHKEKALFRVGRTLAFIENAIKDYDGKVVSSPLNEGLVCVFGVYKRKGEKRHHAKIALEASSYMAKSIMEHQLKMGAESELLPLRMGIHTDKVLIGSLPTGKQNDNTIVGRGAYMGIRLKNACDPFKIILSHETYQNIPLKQVDKAALNPIMIKLGHTEDLAEAIELNPFWDRAEELSRAERSFFSGEYATKAEERTHLGKENLTLLSAVGDSKITNVSFNGLSTVGHFYIGRGVNLLVDIEGNDSEKLKELRRIHLLPFNIEVRWSKPTDNSMFIHGYKFTGLNRGQKEILSRYFQSISKKDGEKVS